MKRLKELREAGNYTQQDIAERVGRTQQTVARWESGKAEPDLAALRDLAMLFGTSVDDLLDMDSKDKIPSTGMTIDDDEPTDGFFGHIGMKMDAGPSWWFPVTWGEYRRLHLQLSDRVSKWASVETLSNQLVMFRPHAVQKIRTLEEAVDEVAGDWDDGRIFDHAPQELFHALDQAGDANVRYEDWVTLRDTWLRAEAAADSEPRDEEALDVIRPQMDAALEPVVAGLLKAFDGQASVAFLQNVALHLVSQELYEDEKHMEKLRATTLHLADGSIERHVVTSECLMYLADFPPDEEGEQLVKLELDFGDGEIFFPESRLVAMVAPLTVLRDEHARFMEEVEGDGPDTLAGKKARSKRKQPELTLVASKPHRASQTLRPLAEFWPTYLEIVRGKNSVRTVEEKERNWRLHVEPRLGAKPVDEIGRQDILDLKEEMADEPAAANNVQALLSHMFNELVKRAVLDANPCSGVEKYEIEPRDIVYTPEELGRLDAAITDEPEQWVKTAFVLIIATGCSRSEVKDAEVSEFHLDDPAPYWLVPAGRLGRKEAHRYNLSHRAAYAIKDWLAVRPWQHTPWLFPNDKGTGPKWQLQKPWERLRERAGVDHGSVQTIRHTISVYRDREGPLPLNLAHYAGR